MLPKPQGTFSRLPLFNSGSLRHLPSSAGVYRLICGPWRRCYVGSTVNLALRFLEHQGQLRRGAHGNSRLQGAYDRLGPYAFSFQVLELYHGRWKPDCLAPAEQRWMDLHARLFNVRPAGSDDYLRAAFQVAKAADGQRDMLGRPKRWVNGRRQVIGGPRSQDIGPKRTRGLPHAGPSSSRGGSPLSRVAPPAPRGVPRRPGRNRRRDPDAG
jgi:hypothetical protein